MIHATFTVLCVDIYTVTKYFCVTETYKYLQNRKLVWYKRVF